MFSGFQYLCTLSVFRSSVSSVISDHINSTISLTTKIYFSKYYICVCSTYFDYLRTAMV